jgi:hypothetical protein
MTKTQLRNLATSLTALLFLVIGGSGVLMFFHLFDSRITQMHEILGLVFVAAILMHLFYNRGSMRTYFAKKIFLIAALVVFATASAFILSAKGGESPKGMIIKAVLSAPLSDVSSLLGIDPADAKQRLTAKGIKELDQQSIGEIANANKISPFEMIAIINQQKR